MSEATQTKDILAYCFRCKAKQPMLVTSTKPMKNGVPLTQGICQVCGCKMSKLGAS